jgi:hypothetical protein
MKKVIMILAVVAAVCGCERVVIDDETAADVVQVKRVRFDVSSEEWRVTRALTADGQDMTDLWIFDYVDGGLVKTLHKTATDVDFNEPTMPLAYGEHTVYFVASRGKSPTVTGTQITWGSPSDTFWKALTLNVGSGTASTVAVTMDRVVTKLRIAVADEVPATIATLEMLPRQWWYGLDYLTGEAVANSDAVRQVAVPASMAGTTGQLAVGFYCLSDDAEWMADVTIMAKDGDGAVIGSVSLADVPFVRNRVTDASGNLFASQSGFSISLNDEWIDSYTLEW